MASTSATSEVRAIRHALLAWYRHYGRHDLPWRQTQDPYAVLVSEVMLQQTQVGRVVPYYLAWLERWPSFDRLAAASPAEVITAWRGLGYNRRALALHAAARTVVERHGGCLPSDPASLRALPGVGVYTEAALRCFARKEPVPVLDTNIARVIARLRLGVGLPRETRPAAIREAASALIPRDRARDHNLALMDVGALVCTARSPACERCPLSRWCSWRQTGRPPGRAAPREPAQPFRRTARYARGRLLDRLREGPAYQDELTALLPAYHRPQVHEYLQSLLRDGLATRLVDGLWALPEA